MTDELEEYCNNLIFKDNSATKYYFDIIGVSDGDNNGQTICYPIITIRQNRKNATGAETFKNAISQLEKNKQVSSVLIREYSGYYDDAEPILENTFKLKKQKKMKKKQQQLPQQGGFGDLGANLKGLGDSLGLMGFENGLSGIIKNTAMQIAQQDRLENANQTIADLKVTQKELEQEIKRLKESNEKLKDESKKLEYELYDTKRDYRNKEHDWQNKLSIKTIAGTAILGMLSQKLNLDKTLQGLMGEDMPSAPIQTSDNTTQQTDLDNIKVQSTNPETAEYVSEINGYISTLDKSRIALVTAICQYTSLGDRQLKEVYGFVLAKHNKPAAQPQQQSQGENNNGDI